VTRHGLNHVWAAATALWPTGHLMLDVVNCDPMVSFDHHSSTRNRRSERQYRNEAIRQTYRGFGRTVFPASAKNQIPHRAVPVDRGFVHPRLSYAFGARNSSGKRLVCLQAATVENRRSYELPDRGENGRTLETLCGRRSTTARHRDPGSEGYSFRAAPSCHENRRARDAVTSPTQPGHGRHFLRRK